MNITGRANIYSVNLAKCFFLMRDWGRFALSPEMKIEYHMYTHAWYSIYLAKCFFLLLRDWGRFALSQKVKIEYHMYTRMIQSIKNLASRWRHQMETVSASLAIWEGKPPVTGGFPSQSASNKGFDDSFDVSLNKRLSKQTSRQWKEPPGYSFWRHCNAWFVGLSLHFRTRSKDLKITATT